MAKHEKTPVQKARHRVTEIARQEKMAEARRLARNDHELLKLILEDAKEEHLDLDEQKEDLEKRIKIKKRELEALQQNIENR